VFRSVDTRKYATENCVLNLTYHPVVLCADVEIVSEAEASNENNDTVAHTSKQVNCEVLNIIRT